VVPRPGQVQHVVFVIQENRSFDNLFHGYPGADTVSSGVTSTGQTITLGQAGLEAPIGIGHGLSDFLAAWDQGKMDGFNLEAGGKSYLPYAYVPQREVQPYWQMAGQYVLADHMFASNIDASFVAHQYLIAGQAGGTVDFPLTNWGCTGGPTDLIHLLTPQRTYGRSVVACFDYQTLADELVAKGFSWRFYAPPAAVPGGLWSAYQAINHICGQISRVNGVCTGPSFVANVISPETQVLTDVSDGKLANVTWVVPDFANSDHTGSLSTTGPSWVASVVNTIGSSKFWPHTVIFVLWDDWGGWYDHVAPPQLDDDGPGLRVPMLCISPFAATGPVNHTQLEFGSLLRLAEDAFGLGRLAASDTRATSAAVGCLNFAQAPRAFAPITAPLRVNDFLRRPHSYRAPDDE